MQAWANYSLWVIYGPLAFLIQPIEYWYRFFQIIVKTAFILPFPALPDVSDDALNSTLQTQLTFTGV